ncbi:hypothetical protein Vafri_331 [Volvox africanus]|nr:hypothetical protein Vafri_331 [Volvox africanus]
MPRNQSATSETFVRVLPGSPWISPLLGAVLVSGRILAAAVEVWVVARHLRAILERDALRAAAAAADADADLDDAVVNSAARAPPSDGPSIEGRISSVPSSR